MFQNFTWEVARIYFNFISLRLDSQIGIFSEDVDLFQVQGHPSDGIKCQVCGAKAAGYHYGVNSCTGCRVSYNQT